jgi:uncharacterized membrane protein YidH (DUF202 family)
MRADSVFDPMLQHERTALAWERTAIATIVAGVLLTRHGAEIDTALAMIGVAQVLVGAVLLIWAGHHYEQLHASLRRGESPVHPTAARIVGLATVGFTGAATCLAAVSLVG